MKRMKKIGIITITGEANIGNILQNFALVKVIKYMQMKALTIFNSFYKFQYAKWNVKAVAKRILKRNYMSSWRRFIFYSFSYRHIGIITGLQLSHSSIDGLHYCGFVFGADQIWNLSYAFIEENKDFFFGTFAPKKKKIAYAASIGIDYIPPEYEAFFTNAINDFSYISVREQKAADLIQQYTGRKVPVTLDPTMLLTCEEWLKIAKKPKYIKKNEKFILVYFLGTMPVYVKQMLDAVCERYHLRQIDLYSEWAAGNPELLENRQFKEKEYFTDPAEFVWLISHCDLMVTDSFHGSVFSILFKKPFRCFERMEKGVENMSSRMQTLFSQFGITNWCIGHEKEDLDHIFETDFSSVDTVLSRERKKSLNYLKEALNSL